MEKEEKKKRKEDEKKKREEEERKKREEEEKRNKEEEEKGKNEEEQEKKENRKKRRRMYNLLFCTLRHGRTNVFDFINSLSYVSYYIIFYLNQRSFNKNFCLCIY